MTGAYTAKLTCVVVLSKYDLQISVFSFLNFEDASIERFKVLKRVSYISLAKGPL